MGAGYGCFRVELVDQPAEVVAPLLEGYRAALQDAVAQVHGGSTGQRDRKKVAQQRQALWQWMQELPDANGKAHGVGVGSLEVRGERSTQSLKPTAAALKAAGRA